MNIYPEDQVDENFFDLYYEPFKKQIWGAGVLVVAVSATYLGIQQFTKNRLEEQWDRYNAAREVAPPATGQTPDPTAMAKDQAAQYEQIVNDYPDAEVTPWAIKGMISAQVVAKDYDGAIASIADLKTRFPDFAMNSLPAAGGSDTESLSDYLRASLESEKEWEAATKYEHRWPTDDRKACIETNQGTFWIGFYSDDAPAHVEAFVSRAKAGEYNGTQVYAVRQAADGSPQLFRAGSKASKSERDPSKHDRDEPLDTIEQEDSRFSIHHVKRVVSSVEMDSGESATAFQVILAPEMTRYNGQNTPFAAVLDQETSLDAIEKIGRAETYGTNPETADSKAMFRMRDNPYPSIYIRRVTILTNEKIEEGHTWDTSRAHTAEPEPWEADRKPDPKPEEFSKKPQTDDAPGSGDDEPKDDPEDDDASENAGADEPADDDGANDDE